MGSDVLLLYDATTPDTILPDSHVTLAIMCLTLLLLPSHQLLRSSSLQLNHLLKLLLVCCAGTPCSCAIGVQSTRSNSSYDMQGLQA